MAPEGGHDELLWQRSNTVALGSVRGLVSWTLLVIETVAERGDHNAMSTRRDRYKTTRGAKKTTANGNELKGSFPTLSRR